MAMGRSGMDHSAMTHEEGGDHSAMGPSAAPGTADTSQNTEVGGGTQTAQADSAATQPTGIGTINSVDADRRMVNISHQPIPALGWPAMTMDMAVAPSVDLEAVPPGSSVTFSLSRGSDGVYVIDSLEAASEGGSMPGMDHGEMGESMPGMRHQ
jgi:Cu/Ag efflux protein CusF